MHHPTPFLFILLKLQTGWGFQRLIFIEHDCSSATLVDSSAPFLSSITAPVPHWWIPAPHFYRALRLQRQTGGFQRPIFIEHYGSSAKLVDSSATFLSSITVPAPNWWIPAPHFYRALRFQRHTGVFQRPIFIEPYGSSATLVDSSAPFLSSVTVPAPHWWIPAPHFYRAVRFQRHTGGFQRPMLMQHYCSSADLVDYSGICHRALRLHRHTGGFQRPMLCSITVPAPHWWIPAPHFYRALRFQRHTGGFQRHTGAQQNCTCFMTLERIPSYMTPVFGERIR